MTRPDAGDPRRAVRSSLGTNCPGTETTAAAVPTVTGCHATPPWRIWLAVSVTRVPAAAALSGAAVGDAMFIPAIPFPAAPLSADSTFRAVSSLMVSPFSVVFLRRRQRYRLQTA